MSKTSAFLEKQPIQAEGEKTLISHLNMSAKPARSYGATAGGWAQTTIVRVKPKQSGQKIQ